mgnify:CR=1 FL=1
MNKIRYILIAFIALVLAGCVQDKVFDELKTVPLKRCLEPMNLSARVDANSGVATTFRWDVTTDAEEYLLEVLDAEQNNVFRDHYMDIPFDLSKVMFITTANSMETIPEPLLDRMELIEVPSYTEEEKLQILKRHLLPKQRKKHGLDGRTLKVSDDALPVIVVVFT